MTMPNKSYKANLAKLVLLTLAAGVPAFMASPDSPVQADSRAAQEVAKSLPFQNPDLPIEERVTNILSLMTLEEKIACLGTNPSVPRLGIRGCGHVEGIHGLAQGGPGGWGRPKVVPTTTFPQGIGLGETWDPDIIRQAAAVEGYEARYIFQSDQYHQGALVVRAPNADLGRDPRWGRTEECYGEDAYFNGTLVVAFVKGLQGDDPKYWQAAALLKHFLANSNEDTRDRSSSDFDERLLREYYSLPFRMGIVEGGARAFMAAYNAMNGIPMTVNPILRDITINEWGEDGIICTDAGGMRLMVSAHKYYPDLEHAAAGAIKAGIGQFLDKFPDAVRGALKQNLLTEVDIDKVLKGNFRVMIRLGLLDPPERVPYTSIKGTEAPWQSDKHKRLARLVTGKSIVLLKNAGDLLPLDQHSVKSIAVIGPRADRVLLDWYSGTPPYTISPLEGIRQKVGSQVNVSYATNNDNGEAVKLARAADVAIVCVGNHPNGGDGVGWAKVSYPSEGREAVDRKAITLEQEELIKQVYAANPRTVVVLISSFPYAINWTQANVPAILHMTHNSQETGSALADALFGDTNPAGRLVETWPRQLDQLPPLLDYDIRHGRTYMYFKGEPLYPFGYGLSYTTFAYANLRTSAAALASDGSVTVSVDVKNTGRRAGEEVVQMYVKHLGSAIDRPLKELKGFQRISLQAGESRTVQMTLQAAQLAYWDVSKKRFAVEPDRLQIMVGRSSADLKLSKAIRITQSARRR